jgi:hypothetical protein
MKAISKAIPFLFLVILLASCNAFTPKPTSTSTPTSTPVPTETSTPTLTSTPEPTATPTKKPTQTPVPPTKIASDADLPVPTGKPAANWSGIPVMPGALAANGDSEGYYYSIKVSPDEVQKFYIKEMKKLGWNKFAIGTGKTKAVMLVFMKDPDVASVAILPQKDDLLYVMLVK